MTTVRKSSVLLLILAVVAIDQAIKVWVKTNLLYGEEIEMLGLDWALIHFVENNGMAFGMSFGGEAGKVALSLFRIFAVGLLGFYVYRLVRQGASGALLRALALIEAGAIGNIVDSVFYGVFFSASFPGSGLARFLPPGGGYAGLLHGRVVDMFYFPVFYGIYPDWVPWVGGDSFLFFRPIFNVADVAISVGVVLLLIFYYRREEVTEEE